MAHQEGVSTRLARQQRLVASLTGSPLISNSTNFIFGTILSDALEEI